MEIFPVQFAKGDSPWRFDIAERKPICRSSARDIYGHTVYCTAKRQLSRRELRKLGLSNHIQTKRSLQSVIALAC
jgi:hypothetical protein